MAVRFRRTHAKSRNGCLRCKQQRKKCDERRPDCSRCATNKHRCQYQSIHSPGMSGTDYQLAVSPEFSPRGSSSISSTSPSLDIHEEISIPSSQSPGTLNATELGLLSHYLSHTSRSIPFDNLDLYALSLGIPNLAFNSKPVMSSLIALAAACKCHQIVKQTRTTLDDQTVIELQSLLELAENHHRSSLQYIREAVSSSEWYDNVLANAALMVLYASASHSIRVHLAGMAKRTGRELPSDILPQHSQWINFTRAAHSAASAVLSGFVNSDKYLIAPISPIGNPSSDFSAAALTPRSGPSEKTTRLFLPVVAFTFSRALQTLRRRVEHAAESLIESHCSEVDACLRALPILEQCAFAALFAEVDGDNSSITGDPLIQVDENPRVSPWVANYMLSVTSISSPKALRRTVMSFLNKAPAEYLNLVQSVLDSSSVDAYSGDWIARGSPTSEMPHLDGTQLLAMDIFAHWLVLVMLLDGVWWIGGIGRWELGQVVSLMKTQNLLHLFSETGETWWPESMYLVNLELIPDI